MTSEKLITAVLVLRAAKGEGDPYKTALHQAGYSPYFIPVLQFDNINEQELSSALLSPHRHSGIIFTSQTAVDSAVHALSITFTDWKKEELSQQWENQPVFVVGKATAQAVTTKLGLSPTGSSAGNAEALSQVILEYFLPSDRPALKPLLFPCGNLRKETLPSKMATAGINLHTITSYNTVASPTIEEKIRDTKVEREECCWVVFFSPSGVTFALKHVQSACKSLKYAAIGPSTAEALREAGVIVDTTASKPNQDCLVAAMMAADSTKPS